MKKEASMEKAKDQKVTVYIQADQVEHHVFSKHHIYLDNAGSLECADT